MLYEWSAYRQNVSLFSSTTTTSGTNGEAAEEEEAVKWHNTVRDADCLLMKADMSLCDHEMQCSSGREAVPE